ncbi:glycoside hydrolase family 13 protein [Brachybacterium huguangmaarense]|uniref:Glycoside hydrolase family 13 protein n=1 Tax=Brachybacterium huguangmaarense TaxID=1652028 RepID=A0ABY6FZA6_9MICO|nr:glycoside hydrolase family 13 protein [Brachybacterium huguangmaarense]UYG15926.1 glycoside hydrolase family 13 protein [Brachybacterium huguangmaarense]
MDQLPSHEPDAAPAPAAQGPFPSPGTDREWWRHAVVYQIYPRSFADSDGDGIGDLPGILSRVPYLADLGVDAVWLSPFYPSALADGGYDVDDHRNVDPRLGTLDDVDALVAALGEHGIRLVIDIVPNHSSNRHVWFQEALASPPGSAARDRYIFRDGKGVDGAEPPADWASGFGGLMWERVPDGQWYLHCHAAEQPDLNWDNPEVHDDFVSTLRFWADRGVAGFRIDVAHLLAKDLSDPLPSDAEMARMPPGVHPLIDRDEVHEIYARWRTVFDEYDPPLTAVGEAWVEPERRSRYASRTGLGQAFNFDLLTANWSAPEFREVIDRNLRQAAETGSSSTWVLSNHDVVRHATRYGLPQGTPGCSQEGKEWLRTHGASPVLDRELGVRRARAATLLLLALPGSTYLYQGEELGLHEVPDLPEDARQDPTYLRTGGADPGRDGCRVPLPWTASGPAFGFSDGGAHLPQPSWFGASSVESQEGDDDSTLALYRRALSTRRNVRAGEDLRWRAARDEVLHIERAGGWHCLTTFEATAELPPGRVLLSSAPLAHEERMVPPNTTVWTLERP